MLASLKGDAPEGDAKDIQPQGETASSAVAVQNLRVIIDRKGRRGKTATIVEGFTLPDAEVDAIASELKRKIGTGGSSRGGEILLQGEWKEKAADILKAMGFKVSR